MDRGAVKLNTKEPLHTVQQLLIYIIIWNQYMVRSSTVCFSSGERRHQYSE